MCWLVASCPAFAQTATANINGYVRDSSGANRSECNRHSARMTEQQLVRNAETNSEGFYQLLCAAAGNVRALRFEATGFQRQTQTGLELTVNQNLRVDAALQVGTVETQVTSPQPRRWWRPRQPRCPD